MCGSLISDVVMGHGQRLTAPQPRVAHAFLPPLPKQSRHSAEFLSPDTHPHMADWMELCADLVAFLPCEGTFRQISHRDTPKIGSENQSRLHARDSNWDQINRLACSPPMKQARKRVKVDCAGTWGAKWAVPISEFDAMKGDPLLCEGIWCVPRGELPSCSNFVSIGHEKYNNQ